MVDHTSLKLLAWLMLLNIYLFLKLTLEATIGIIMSFACDLVHPFKNMFSVFLERHFSLGLLEQCIEMFSARQEHALWPM